MRTFFSLSLLVVLAGCNYYSRKQQPQSTVPESMSGLRAFRSAVFPFVREKCAGCHGETQSPLFAQADPSAAYRLALAYADFAHPEDSVFVLRTRNGHCGANCRTDGTQMKAAIETWWKDGQQGESQPPEPVLLKTVGQLIPAASQTKYTRYTWSLEEFGPDFRGASFSLEVRRVDDQLVRFRAPRLHSGQRALRVRGPRLWWNGHFDSATDVFRRVDVAVNPLHDPVLGGETGSLLVRSREPLELAIEFPELVATLPNQCRDLETFRDSVLPILGAKCARCHGDSGKGFSLQGSPEQVCAEARQRATLTYPEGAPLVGYPYLQRNDHPIKAIGAEEARTLLYWLGRERDHESAP